MPHDATFPPWRHAILSLRQCLGLTQSEFGLRLHSSAMAVSRWESGKQEPSSRCLIQLGNMAGQPDCWLFWSWAGLKSSDLRQMFPGTWAMARMTTSQDFEIVHAEGGSKSPRLKGAPRVQLAGGEFSDFESVPAEEFIAAPTFWCPNPHATYCLRVKGTSMSPLIDDGDLVAVDGTQTDPGELNQKVVVALHRGDGLSLARFVSATGVQLLESENHEYGAVTIQKDRRWQIVGKVLWWIRKVS